VVQDNLTNIWKLDQRVCSSLLHHPHLQHYCMLLAQRIYIRYLFVGITISVLSQQISSYLFLTKSFIGCPAPVSVQSSVLTAMIVVNGRWLGYLRVADCSVFDAKLIKAVWKSGSLTAKWKHPTLKTLQTYPNSKPWKSWEHRPHRWFTRRQNLCRKPPRFKYSWRYKTLQSNHKKAYRHIKTPVSVLKTSVYQRVLSPTVRKIVKNNR